MQPLPVTMSYWPIAFAFCVVIASVIWNQIKSPVLNDMNIYHNVDWWDLDKSPFAGLLKSNAVRLPVFLKAFPVNESKAGITVLDVGCGGGYLSEAVAELGYTVSGIDLSGTSIENARNHAAKSPIESVQRIDYRVGSVFNMPFPSDHFDVVIASDVLEHVGDVPRALAEIRRVLKPAGKLTFDCINRTWRSVYFIYFVMQELLGIIPKGAHDWRLFVTVAEMNEMLEKETFITSPQEWIGRHWKYSYWDLMWGGRKKFVKGLYLDEDVSEFYMGSATKPAV